MYNLKLGILIIGSLLWETEKFDREGWRRERLNIDVQQQVETHTRYGRISESRGGTYTMVFSTSAAPSTAIVVPCRTRAKNATDIFEEARRLAIAENLEDDGNWKTFGAVGVLPNPASKPARRALESWTAYFRDHLNAHCDATTTAAKGESPSLDGNGLLQIDWPRCLDPQISNDCDMLLATANAPTFNNGTYPTAEEIAKKYIEAAQADYFKNNVLHAIVTADDVEIWKHIKAANPAWIATDEYGQVSTILDTTRHSPMS
jgi:hypothetical protein